MFPDIESQNRHLAFHERRILIGRGRYADRAAFSNQPSPARTEDAGRRRRKGRLKFGKAAKSAVYRISQRTLWLTAAIRTHNRPEKAVIGIAAAVVANSGADTFRRRIQIGEDVFDALAI